MSNVTNVPVHLGVDNTGDIFAYCTKPIWNPVSKTWEVDVAKEALNENGRVGVRRVGLQTALELIGATDKTAKECFEKGSIISVEVDVVNDPLVQNHNNEKLEYFDMMANHNAIMADIKKFLKEQEVKK